MLEPVIKDNGLNALFFYQLLAGADPVWISSPKHICRQSHIFIVFCCL